MAKFKLKVEEIDYIDAVQDIFCSFNKSGVYKKYDKNSNEDIRFSYGLLTYDFSALKDKVEVEDNSLYLQEFFVEDKKRGTGYSNELMNQMITFVKEKGVSSVYLTAEESWKGTSFEKLKSFYERFGFEQVSNKIFKLDVA